LLISPQLFMSLRDTLNYEKSLLQSSPKQAEVVIPGKQCATRNSGFTKDSGFRPSPE
jgi:hypothetical protein